MIACYRTSARPFRAARTLAPMALLLALTLAVPGTALSNQLTNPALTAELAALAPAELVERWLDAGRAEQAEIEGTLLTAAASAQTLLRQLLADGTIAEKRLSASLLGLQRDTDSVVALIAAAAADSDSSVRRDALIALRRIGAPSSASAMRLLLAATNDPTLLKNALAVLGRVGGPTDAFLVRLLSNHSDPTVRVTAAGVAAMLGDDGLEADLVDAVYSDESLTRLTALYYLGFTDGIESGALLNAIVADPDAAWRSYARIALAERELRALQASARPEQLGVLAADLNTTVARWAIEKLAEDGGSAALA
ncbi:MAG: HEAT repeat protein [Candidatus Binatia bacterium]|jgi:HEAT repeat protein